MSTSEYDSASFRDPSGRVFTFENSLYREVHEKKLNDTSELCAFLASPAGASLQKMIVESELIPSSTLGENYKEKFSHVLRHRKLHSLTYSYEWCPEQLREAAIFTLDLQIELLKNNYTLKDASPFNVMFEKGHPIFIDFHSVEKCKGDYPWEAWNKFQQFFVLPLLIYHFTSLYVTPQLNLKLGKITPNEAYKILRKHAFFSWTLLKYIRLPHFVSWLSSKDEGSALKVNQKVRIRKALLLANLEGLRSTLQSLNFQSKESPWKTYQSQCHYGAQDQELKKDFIDKLARSLADSESYALDIGANVGEYSFLVSPFFRNVIALEADAESVNDIFIKAKKVSSNVIPLLGDFSSPTPSLGWANKERKSFQDRFPQSQLTLALAILHHLRISANVPLELILTEIKKCSRNLIIEWIPLEDPMTLRLLNGRDASIYSDYNQENFLALLKKHYRISSEQKLSNGRCLYFAQENS